jgi:hypothetical protein
MMREDEEVAVMPATGARQNLNVKEEKQRCDARRVWRNNKEDERGMTYARHIRAAVPELTAMMSPLLKPNKR